MNLYFHLLAHCTPFRPFGRHNFGYLIERTFEPHDVTLAVLFQQERH